MHWTRILNLGSTGIQVLPRIIWANFVIIFTIGNERCQRNYIHLSTRLLLLSEVTGTVLPAPGQRWKCWDSIPNQQCATNYLMKSRGCTKQCVHSMTSFSQYQYVMMLWYMCVQIFFTICIARIFVSHRYTMTLTWEFSFLCTTNMPEPLFTWTVVNYFLVSLYLYDIFIYAIIM